jgi:hypothetical protein
MTAVWTLEEPALGQFALDPDDGFAVVAYDLGYPAARVVTDPITEGDGEDDWTAFYGARVVTLDVRAVGSAGDRQAAAGRLRQYMEPRRRVTLRWVSANWGECRMVGRGDRFAHAVGSALSGALMRTGWRIPSGVIEAYAASEVTMYPTSGAVAGRTYDLVFNRVYPAGSVPGKFIYNSDGTTRAWPTVRLFGPVTAPVAQLYTSGGYWSFPTLTIPAGDFVEIDCRNRTVLTNGLPGSSVFSSLDFATLRWGWIEPGSNEARFTGTSTTAQTEMRVTWRAAYI